jgi:hypothetical protein
MAAAGFINGNYNGTGTTIPTYVAPANSPQNAFNGAIMLAYTNAYQVAGGAATQRLAMLTGRNIPVNVMRELDTKMDDGVPNTGVMRSTTNAAAPDPNGSLAACVAAGQWDVSANAADCGGAYLY